MRSDHLRCAPNITNSGMWSYRQFIIAINFKVQVCQRDVYKVQSRKRPQLRKTWRATKGRDSSSRTEHERCKNKVPCDSRGVHVQIINSPDPITGQDMDFTVTNCCTESRVQYTVTAVRTRRPPRSSST
ncbi:hypothetical protein JOB18_016135 [Solea senegalensis]|uniref:Uncharacterized protein n=1 Tax=Solea senegalensis TaxID=28829 RepID=A0AAV6QM79_SOLSE|nr:hypothetical protein JOB18_016135 [Solea senegalensis]